MTITSASKLEMNELCMGSAVLEGVEHLSFYAELGTAKHHFMATALVKGREAALAETDERFRPACAAIDLSELPAGQPGAWIAEVSYAFDLETGRARELGRGLERRYEAAGLGPTEVPGTIDYVGMRIGDGLPVVIDAKTGWTRVTRAQDNLQLLFAAVCAVDVFKKQGAHGAILYPGPEGDEPYFDVATWDAFDLDAARLRLIELGKRILAARRAYHEGDPKTGEVNEPRLAVGKHCRYCPAITTCPAQGRFIRRLVHDEEATLADLRGLLNPETGRLVYDRIKAAKLVLERAEAVLYAYAANNPIPLSDGRVLGKTETQRETLNAPMVARVLSEMFDEELAFQAMETKATKASVKRALAKRGGSVSKRMKQVLDTLRDRGGVRVKVKESVKEFQPGVQDVEGEEAQ